MFVVTKEIEFDAAHRVPNHKSKCRNLHGHRYKVIAAVQAPNLHREGSDEGMVVDFGDLKTLMMETIHDVHDHGAIFYADDELCGVWRQLTGMRIEYWDVVPTAENMAGVFFYELQLHDRHPFWISNGLQYVEVWETPTSKARYTREGT